MARGGRDLLEDEVALNLEEEEKEKKEEEEGLLVQDSVGTLSSRRETLCCGMTTISVLRCG